MMETLIFKMLHMYNITAHCFSSIGRAKKSAYPGKLDQSRSNPEIISESLVISIEKLLAKKLQSLKRVFLRLFLINIFSSVVILVWNFNVFIDTI